MHTGRLESYNNLILKYVPKLILSYLKAIYLKSIIDIMTIIKIE